MPYIVYPADPGHLIPGLQVFGDTFCVCHPLPYNDSDIAEWSSCLKLAASYGIRTFWDLQQNQEKHDREEWQRKMAQLEMRVSQLDEYRSIAFFHHLVFSKEKT